MSCQKGKIELNINFDPINVFETLHTTKYQASGKYFRLNFLFRISGQLLPAIKLKKLKKKPT